MCIKLLYPSNRVRTVPPVSVRVRNRVSVSFSFIFKLISGKECIADCVPCFELVRMALDLLGVPNIIK